MLRIGSVRGYPFGNYNRTELTPKTQRDAAKAGWHKSFRVGEQELAEKIRIPEKRLQLAVLACGLGSPCPLHHLPKRQGRARQKYEFVVQPPPCHIRHNTDARKRSHREDQEKFYDQNIFRSFPDLQKKIVLWNTYYNNLEHCGLNGKTPNEYLADYQLTNPPNVCT